jgi:hypothetical protein
MALDGRLNLRLRRLQLRRLREHAARLELSIAELVRRAVDDWLDRREGGGA